MMEAKNQTQKFDLEDRLVNFAVRITRIVESLPNTKAGGYIGNQLIRSGISPALNYGEAQSAESRSDFIHKIKVVLKELRESSVSLKLIRRFELVHPAEKIDQLLDETNQLIAIFVKSIATA